MDGVEGGPSDDEVVAAVAWVGLEPGGAEADEVAGGLSEADEVAPGGGPSEADEVAGGLSEACEVAPGGGVPLVAGSPGGPEVVAGVPVLGTFSGGRVTGAAKGGGSSPNTTAKRTPNNNDFIYGTQLFLDFMTAHEQLFLT